MAKINFGGTIEEVATREEFPLEKAREVLKNETIAVIGYGIQGPGQACLWILFLPFSCAQSKTGVPVDVKILNDSLRNVYAPDKRVALFDIHYQTNEKFITLQGLTTVPEAHRALLQGLSRLSYKVTDEIKELPDRETLGDKTWGLVRVSVCNLRTEGDYDAGQSSQGIMGMPVRVLRRDGWLQIQTPDRYLSWVDPSSIWCVSKAELEAWNKARQIVVTSIFGFVYSQPDEKSQTVSDVVASDRFKWLATVGKFYQVEYPDGRRGYLSQNISMPYRFSRCNSGFGPKCVVADARKRDAASATTPRSITTPLPFPFYWNSRRNLWTLPLRYAPPKQRFPRTAPCPRWKKWPKKPNAINGAF